MQKKNTTPKIDARDLPALISAVFKHPDTPALVYNALGEAITDMSNHIDNEAPEMIARALTAHAEFEAQRKGGAK